MRETPEEPGQEQPRNKESRRDKSRERNRSRDRSHKRHHRPSHQKDHDRDERDPERHHQRKRSRYGDNYEDKHRRSRKPRREEERMSAKKENETNEEDTGEWIEAMSLSTNTGYDEIPSAPTISETVAVPVLKRDSWMTEPAADFVDYTQKGAQKSAPRPVTKPDYRPVIHKNELNGQLREGKSVDEYAQDTNGVGYMFGDEGSKWRMIRLKRVYQAASEDGKSLESVAIERYGDLKTFDEAREEEMELERRDMYGKDRRDMKEKPTGDLYQERLKRVAAKDKERRDKEEKDESGFHPAGAIENLLAPTPVKILDQTALNRLKAAYLRAQIKNDPKAAEMEKEYIEAAAAVTKAKPPTQEVVLSAMDSRVLVGLEGRVGRVVVEGKRGKLVEKEDMALEDMVREEKRTRGAVAGGEGMLLAERIARDAKFSVSIQFLLPLCWYEADTSRITSTILIPMPLASLSMYKRAR